ncbi:MAG TPA: ergothioneine biosynthesis protein EgtB [Noviherbaspirillum sp.]|nr:ergothioneine biosynthesis protein EgtB [Noviherbaspirillum sp.]
MTAALYDRFRRVRAETLALAAPLSEEDCCVQSMTDASPVKWHLAHTSWFFETFILERFERPFHAFQPAFRMLFNSYYNGVGDKHPRPQRGMITRPGLAEVLAYRRNVDERMAMVIGEGAASSGLGELVELGLQHEQQHQELVLTDLKHLLSMNPLKPAYAQRGAVHATLAPEHRWIGFDGGVVHIGHAGDGFCFDNELPRHRQFVEPYALSSRLVTNAEYLAFIEDGGYRNPAVWLAEGWDWVRNGGNGESGGSGAIEAPLYWHRAESGWQEFTLHGMQALEPDRPATHLSFYEADAFARWAGARLPTEAEWEHAAASCPGDIDPCGIAQLFGVSWQWTSSSYSPYPGFTAPRGAIGEYNGKFMCNQYVLRGSSIATPAGHTRISYRNFFPAYARWQFSGIRLARSAWKA